MILTIGVILSLMLAMLAFARVSVFDEIRTSEANKDKGIARDLAHGPLVVFRIVVGGILVGLAMIAMAFGVKWGLLQTWQTLLMCGVAWATFTSYHRYTFNTKRKLKDGLKFHALYLDPDNEYDAFFLRKVTGWSTAALRIAHPIKYFGNVGGYADKVHKAGRWAYAFEIAVLCLSVFLLLFTNNP